MAHPCCQCGGECYCKGDIDDCIVSKTPVGCNGCGCDDYDDFDDDEDYGDYSCPKCGKEYDEIDHEYQICHHCKFNNNPLTPN